MPDLFLNEDILLDATSCSMRTTKMIEFLISFELFNIFFYNILFAVTLFIAINLTTGANIMNRIFTFNEHRRELYLKLL